MSRPRFNSLRRFERLEERRMMAADIDFDNGVVTIEGTNNDDYILVQTNPQDAGEILVTVQDKQTGKLLEQRDINRANIIEIVAFGFDGNDAIENNTNIRSRLYGGNGNDGLTGGANNDLLDGGAGRDALWGREGDDALYGGTGDDGYIFYFSNQGSDVVFEAAAEGVDTLDFFFSLDGGVNVNLANTAEQTVNSSLKLRLSSDTGIENVFGTDYADVIVGNSRENKIWGLDGSDRLYGGSGADQLLGGNGNDELYGGLGDDSLYGGAQNDILSGDAGNDYLSGDAGNDVYRFWGSANIGTDVVNEAAAQNTDKFDFSNFGGAVNVNLANTSEQVVNTTLLRLKLNVESAIEDIVGSKYDDTLRGNSRNNVLNGNDGNDKLYGGLGADKLFGDYGHDWLYGESGNDELFGGYGDDYLFGGADLDILDGGADNDYLDGGYDAYADTLRGGKGKDKFIVHVTRFGTQMPSDPTVDYDDKDDLLAYVWH